MDVPTYFDSQAQAAGMLGVDVYTLKEAKAAGCPAFKGGGRIRRDELLTWLKQNRESKIVAGAASGAAKEDSIGSHSWDRRRQFLFDIMEFIDEARLKGTINSKEFKRITKATVPLVIKLGAVWKAGIDAKGFRRNYSEQFARDTG
jgi:hypothetical protein